MKLLGHIYRGVKREGPAWIVLRIYKFSGLKFLLTTLEAFQLRFRVPFHNSLVAVYDLDVSPLTHDALAFFASAELERQRRGFEFLQIVIVPGSLDGVRLEEETYDAVVDRNDRLWRLHNILVPCAQMLSKVAGVYLPPTRQDAAKLLNNAPQIFPERYKTYAPLAFDAVDYGNFTAALNRFGLRQYFSSGISGRKYVEAFRRKNGATSRLVVITLRQYDYMTERNSDLSAWLAFARRLDSRKYTVVFVPDTAKAYDESMDEVAREFHVVREAAFSTTLRMAFYEAAFVNMSVSCGPAALCIFSHHVRYLMFKLVVPSAPMATSERLVRYGYIPGETPTFTSPLQKWVWEDDRVDVLDREFRDFERTAEERGIPDCPDLPEGTVARRRRYAKG